MVGAEEFVARDDVSADAGGSAQLTDAGFPGECPESAIAKAHNKIRIKVQDFIAESVKFMGVAPADIAGGEQRGVPGDAFGFGAAEVFKCTPGRVLVEDVGATDVVLVIGPDAVDGFAVAGGVVSRETFFVCGGEGDNPRDVEHAEEFDAGGPNKTNTEFLFLVTPSLAHKKYRF